MARSSFVAGAIVFVFGAQAAQAQNVGVLDSVMVSPNTFNTLVPPSIAPDYFRDHNVAVLEKWRDDFEAPGAAIGSFVFHPQATLGFVSDNNVYATETSKVGDIVGVMQLGGSLASDWSRHSLSLQVDTDQRRYASQSRRNQSAWDIQPSGRIDLGSHVALSADARVGRYFQAPFSNDLSPDAQILSNFFRSAGTLRARYTAGRVRMTGAFDYSDYRFATLRFADGSLRDQSARNRDISQLSGQIEYAASPSFAFYVGGSTDSTQYNQPANGNSDLTSTGANVLGGVSFDLAGSLRGLIGMGYSARTYPQAAEFNAAGLSYQAKLDCFPLDSTTVSISTQRLIMDSGLGSAPLVDARASLEVDQAIGEQIVLVVSGALAKQSFFNLEGYRMSRLFQTNVRYQASPWLGFRAELSYRYSRPSTPALGTVYQGFLFGISATVRR